MKSKKNNITAKQYKLKGGVAPLSFMLPTKNSARYPLMYFDESKGDNGQNRALRYARNQKSPFEDEQDGNAILEPIVFVDGFLSVPKENQVLQEFLHYHPLNGKKFVEVDNEKDAEQLLNEMDLQDDAMSAARKMAGDELYTLFRVLYGKDPERYSTSEIKRDVRVYAKREPAHFLSLLDDSSLKLQANVSLFLDKGLIGFRKEKKEVWYNTPSNKTKMLAIPYGKDPMELITSYLQSDEGIEMLKVLEDLAKE